MKTNDEIIAGNRLLAEFMGFKQKENNTIQTTKPFGIGTICADDLRFHSSWDWLMPVVEKMVCTENTGKEWERHYEKIHDSLWDINIESVWLTCVEFVKWLNEQQ